MHLTKCGLALLFVFLIVNENPTLVLAHNCGAGVGSGYGQFGRVYSADFENYEDCEKQCGYVTGEAETMCKAVEGGACMGEAAANTVIKIITFGALDTGGVACQAAGGACTSTEAVYIAQQRDCEEYCAGEFKSKYELTQGNVNLTREVLLKGQSELKNNLKKLSESIANNQKELIDELIKTQERIIDEVVQEIQNSESRVKDSISNSKDEVLAELKHVSNISLTLLKAIQTDIDVLGEDLHYVQHVALFGDVFKILDTIETRYDNVQHDTDTGLIIRNYESDQYMEAVTDPNFGMAIGIEDIKNMLITGDGRNWAKSFSIYEEDPQQFCSAKWFAFFSLKMTKALFHLRNGRRMVGSPLPASYSEKEYHDEHLAHYSQVCQCSQENLPTVNNKTPKCNTDISISTVGDVCQVECWGQDLDVFTCEEGGHWRVDQLWIEKSPQENWICKGCGQENLPTVNHKTPKCNTDISISTVGDVCQVECLGQDLDVVTCEEGGHWRVDQTLIEKSPQGNWICKGSVIFITGGSGTLDSTEVLDPSSSTSPCSRLTANLPDEREVHSMSSMEDGEIVLCGGGWGSTLTSCISTRSPGGPWRQHSTINTHRWNHASAVTGDLHMVAGFYSGDTASSLEDGRWKERGKLPYSIGGGACAVTINQTAVFVTGGTSARSKTAIWNPSTDEWTPMADMKQGRYRHGCSVLTSTGGDKYVLVAGGWGGDNALSSSELYSVQGNTWTSTGSLKQARSDGAMVATDDRNVFMMGGYTGGKPFDSVEKFHFETRTWGVTPFKMKKARQDFAAVSVSRNVFC